MHNKQLFWLHIKKAAGTSTRALLQQHYVEVKRKDKPKNFIQATPEEYNDILNNYRVVLGDYQFRRSLFAKTYLYPNQWNNMYSFAFSREPIDRCISMFHYLFKGGKGVGYLRTMLRSVKTLLRTRKIVSSTSYAFDVFLDYAHRARQSDSIYKPLGNHFTTHTAPMWDDITDLEGNVLLKEVFRLEALIEGINRAFCECGIDKRLEHGDELFRKKNRNRQRYTPSSAQIRKIEQIYPKDFEVYETAWH